MIIITDDMHEKNRVVLTEIILLIVVVSHTFSDLNNGTEWIDSISISNVTWLDSTFLLLFAEIVFATHISS